MDDAAPAAFVISDRTGTITHWSAGAVDLFGHAVADAEGTSLDIIVPEELRDRHWAAFHRVMETDEGHLDGATINLPVRRADDSVVPHPARFVFLRDPRGRVASVMGIYVAPRGGEAPFSPVED